MGLPTGDIITLNSGNFTLSGNKTCSLSIVLQDKTGGTNFDSSYGITVLDIGDYEINFDLQDDASDLTKFLYNVNTFSGKFATKLSDTVDFGDILSQLEFSDIIKVSFTYDGNTDLFLCQKNDFEYDFMSRSVSFKCFSPFKFVDAIQAYDTSSVQVDAHYGGGDGTIYDYDVVTFRDLIDVYLNTFNTSSIKVQSNFAFRKADITGFSSGESLDDVTFVVLNALTGNDASKVQGANNIHVIQNHTQLRTAVLSGGLIESAIVGTMFGEAFYVRRNYSSESDTNYFSTISSSDLESFNIKFHSSAVKSISVGTNDAATPEASESFNPLNPQTLALTIPNFAATGDFGFADDTPPSIPNPQEITAVSEVGGNGIFTDVPMESNPSAGVFYTGEALTIYKKILGAVDSTTFKGTILGITDTNGFKLKPYEWIKLDTNISAFVKPSNQKVRPSKLKYRFKENKINFEGYSI